MSFINIDFDVEIKNSILELLEDKETSLLTTDVDILDKSGFLDDVKEFIEHKKYFTIKMAPIIDSFEQISESSSLNNFEEVVVDSKQKFKVRSRKQFRFTGQTFQLKITVGLAFDKFLEDFPFLEKELGDPEQYNVSKTIVFLLNDKTEPSVQDFRIFTPKDTKLDFTSFFAGETENSIDENVNLKSSFGRRNPYISDFWTSYEEDDQNPDKHKLYVYFLIDAVEFIERFCKFPKIINSHHSSWLQKEINISFTNSVNDTIQIKPVLTLSGQRFIFFHFEDNLENNVGEKIKIQIGCKDVTINAIHDAIGVFYSLIRGIKDKDQKVTENSIQYLSYFYDFILKNGDFVLSVSQSDNEVLIRKLVDELQKVVFGLEKLAQSEGTPFYNKDNQIQEQTTVLSARNNGIYIEKELHVEKEFKNKCNIGKVIGLIEDNEVHIKSLEQSLIKKNQEYFTNINQPLTLSPEIIDDVSNSLLKYLIHDATLATKCYRIDNLEIPQRDALLLALLNNKKTDDMSIFKSETFVKNLAVPLFNLFGSVKQKESQQNIVKLKTEIDKEKIKPLLNFFTFKSVIDETNERDFSSEYYNLSSEETNKFLMLGEEYVSNLPNNTKSIMASFAPNSTSIMSLSIFRFGNVEPQDYSKFFFQYQLSYKLEYLDYDVGSINEVTWKPLLVAKAKEKKKLLCRISLNEDNNLVSSKLLKHLNMKIMNEVFILNA